jgi:organic hydroperoxide reductase OsmC/OhrA
MEWDGTTYHFTRVTLNPVVTVKKGTDLTQARALHHDAHEACFIARSVNFPVVNEPVMIEAVE